MKTIFAFLLVLLALPAAMALAIDPPLGPVLLTISGRIEASNADGKAQLDGAMLRALPQHVIKTKTPWTEGVAVFSGPLLRDVLALVGGDGETLRMTAINDYQVDVPAGDATAYETILAMSMNGEPLIVRTKGPLWLIYPWSDVDGLRTETYFSRSIWQLKAIEIR